MFLVCFSLSVVWKFSLSSFYDRHDADDANGAVHSIGVRAFERTSKENAGRRRVVVGKLNLTMTKNRLSSQLPLRVIEIEHLMYCYILGNVFRLIIKIL